VFLTNGSFIGASSSNYVVFPGLGLVISTGKATNLIITYDFPTTMSKRHHSHRG